ncbi:MIF protein mif-2 [Trichostrongylus colubriformis]|uniref:MIF protein mif-2 n=1 Tax=Trichostrongylus colubriformis TaxID=6319 RepID=A0AAN8FKK8_TRICO
MPMVRVATNLPDKDVPANFEERLTDLLADSMNKPRTRIAVEIQAGQRILHGGVRNPVVIIKIESIGALEPESNIRHTQRVTQLCQEVLHVPKDKVVISYFDLAPTNVGFGGTTVAAAAV